MGGFLEKKREEVILGKIHRNISELQVPGKGTHPIWKDFTLAWTAYQIIPTGNFLKEQRVALMHLVFMCISLTAVLLKSKISL